MDGRGTKLVGVQVWVGVVGSVCLLVYRGLVSGREGCGRGEGGWEIALLGGGKW